jgi:molecular chaperone DnaJ
MAGKLKNYYKILELELFADEAAVKAAFKKLVRKYHPDVDRTNPALEEKFKLINEAHEMLSNAEKRAFYDESLKLALGLEKDKKQQSRAKLKPSASKTAQQTATGPKATAKSETVPPLNEFFESFLKKGFGTNDDGKGESFFHNSQKQSGSGSSGRKTTSKRGQDVTVEAAITPLEAEEGVVKTVNVQHNEICRRCAGTGKVNGTPCTGCNGDKILQRHKKIDVRIPKGVKNGSKVRVAGEGGRGTEGGEHGDLFLLIRIDIDPGLRIEGLDVYSEVPIGITDAVLGATLDIPTVGGKVKMTVPPLTSSGKVFRLKEQGVQNGASRGDHFVTVRIVAPDNLNKRELELYNELARLQQERKPGN